MIASGDADVLMTYATDRLARDQVKLAVIVHAVQKAGGRVSSATEDLDTGPLGTFLRSSLAFAAEMELTKIRERTNRALDARYVIPKRSRPGWKPLYGYAKVGSGADATYVPHPAESEVVKRIFDLAAGGHSRYAIVRALEADGIPGPTGNGWYTSALARILGRECYWTGEHEAWRTATIRRAENDNRPETVARPAEERYRVAIPAFVDPGVAGLARSAQARNSQKRRRLDRDPAVGVLRYGFHRCHACGGTLSVTITRGAGDYRYRCTTRGCTAPVSMLVARQDAELVAWVEEVFSTPLERRAGGSRPRNRRPSTWGCWRS